MKQSIKYFAILVLFVLVFFAGKFYGEFRWMTLMGYINLNKSLSYLSYIESNRTDDLRDRLHNDLNAYVIETSPFLKYAWLSPIDVDAIKITYMQTIEYRERTAIEYKDEPSKFLQKEADKILMNNQYNKSLKTGTPKNGVP